ncbi:hypothetical protein C8J56DRAFT_398395 [Mycena floridula]|nr:hypothetical protein C8J56DRAFT_398395 [Mycena floridula]
MELQELRSKVSYPPTTEMDRLQAENLTLIARLEVERDEANQECLRQREFAVTEMARLERLLKECQDEVAVKDATIMTQQTQILEQSKIAQATSDEVDRLSGLLEASEDDVAARDATITNQKARILTLVSQVEKEKVPTATSRSVEPEAASPTQSKRKASGELQPSSRYSRPKRDLDSSSQDGDQVTERSGSVHQTGLKAAMAAAAKTFDLDEDLSDLSDLSTDESEDEEVVEQAKPVERRNQSHQGGVRKRYRCGWPGCSFSTIYAHLDRHMRSHNGERPYECRYKGCELRFLDCSARKKHEMAHIGERPYKCTKCNSAFGRKSHLVAHQSVHSRDNKRSVYVSLIKRKVNRYLGESLPI